MKIAAEPGISSRPTLKPRNKLNWSLRYAYVVCIRTGSCTSVMMARPLLVVHEFVSTETQNNDSHHRNYDIEIDRPGLLLGGSFRGT